MDMRRWELGVRRLVLTLLFASAALAAHGQELGRISGKVTDAATGAPVRGVSVHVYDAQGYFIASGYTDVAGDYATAAGLPAGSYYALTADDSGYLNELYDGLPCEWWACTVTSGTPIPVVAGATTSDVDFALQAGGRISGKVTDAATGAPLRGVSVEIYDAESGHVATVSSDVAGDYVSDASLPAGSYYARTAYSSDYLDEIFDDIACVWGTCTVTSGTPIPVTAGATTSGVDFALRAGGRISGKVTDAATAAPLRGVSVQIYNAQGGYVTSASSDVAGDYLSDRGLPAGSYYARTVDSSDYLDEIYDDVPCVWGACTVTSGAPIPVTAGATASGIDFALQAGGRISGKVTDAATGAPLQNVSVAIYDAQGDQVTSAFTDVAGDYLTDRGLPAGSYHARTTGNSYYLDELYDDIPCVRGECTVTGGAPIPVTAGATVSGIDFALQAGGRISGRVTDAATGAPLEGVLVEIYDAQGGSITYRYSDVAGNYVTDRGLPPGSYFARTEQGSEYLDELYDNVACVWGACAVTSGTPIAVAAGATRSGIDFALRAGGRIGGKVTDAATGAPLRGVSVRIYDAQAGYITSASSDVAGDYTTDRGLPPGSYYARTVASSSYLDELYDDIPCVQGQCTVTNGTPISVAAGAATRGIDFALRAGGRISGKVTDAATGAPVPGVSVEIHEAQGGHVTVVYSGVAGDYVSDLGLPAGNYYARTVYGSYYLDELYDDIPCASWTCTVTSGTPIPVAAGATTTGIDFALRAGGRISGKVTDAATGAPLRGVSVEIYDAQGSYVTYARTDVAGDYTTEPELQAGSYYARTTDGADYLDELWNDVSCVWGACTVTSGTPIPVAAGATTTGIDFALRAGGRISGKVTDAATGAPLRGVSVHIHDAQGGSVTDAYSDVAGDYTTDRGLPPGSYFAHTTDSPHYLDELYDDIACVWAACAFTSGTAIPVTAGATASGIDFALQAGGRISGKVTDASTGAPLRGVAVHIYDAQGGYVTSASSDIAGDYTTDRGLPTGSYYARTDDDSDYLGELYDDVACVWGACTVTSGLPIPVTAAATTSGIDFALQAGGRISGRITDASTGAPLQSVRVEIYDALGASVAYAYSDVAGGYVSEPGLPAGSYYARTSVESYYGNGIYANELYAGISCALGCTVTSGTPIIATPGTTTTGIDFALAPARELTRGSDVLRTFAGPAAVDRYVVAGEPYTSYEVVVDGISGDAQPLELVRLYSDGSTPQQHSTSIGTGMSRSLRWQNPYWYVGAAPDDPCPEWRLLDRLRSGRQLPDPPLRDDLLDPALQQLRRAVHGPDPAESGRRTRRGNRPFLGGLGSAAGESVFHGGAEGRVHPQYRDPAGALRPGRLDHDHARRAVWSAHRQGNRRRARHRHELRLAVTVADREVARQLQHPAGRDRERQRGDESGDAGRFGGARFLGAFGERGHENERHQRDPEPAHFAARDAEQQQHEQAGGECQAEASAGAERRVTDEAPEAVA